MESLDLQRGLWVCKELFYLCSPLAPTYFSLLFPPSLPPPFSASRSTRSAAGRLGQVEVISCITLHNGLTQQTEDDELAQPP